MIPPELVVIAAVVAALFAHRIHCRWFPESPCPTCRRRGDTRIRSGQHSRPCARCGGSGRVKRFGVRFWDAVDRHR